LFDPVLSDNWPECLPWFARPLADDKLSGQLVRVIVVTWVLSGGERQRISLAAGTVRPPRLLLLLDEPVSALDPANRELALSLVSSLTSQGVAVLAVFHDLGAVRQLATRVVRMEGGQVVASGTASEILGELEAVS
jgi:ABC-type glutathione transport system ATPase component